MTTKMESERRSHEKKRFQQGGGRGDFRYTFRLMSLLHLRGKEGGGWCHGTVYMKMLILSCNMIRPYRTWI